MNFGKYNESVYISEEEYYDWLKTADWTGTESATFTSFCGPHEFAIPIRKNQNEYELQWGWYPEKDTTLNPKHEYKTTYWWGIKKLYGCGQHGEGI